MLAARTVLVRRLSDVIDDQQRAFTELIVAQRRLGELTRQGRQVGIVVGTSSEADEAMAELHDALHRLESLSAEALQSALSGPHD
jgi:hypothetical protein